MQNIGPRLKRLRQKAELSQRELARRAGVSNATISVLENGTSDPTLGLLMKVLEGLEISVADFFADSQERSPRVFFPKDDMVDVGSGSIRYLQPGHNIHGRAMQILYETYAPGSGTGSEHLSHEGEEGGFIIRGKLEVSVGDQRRVLGPGDAYYFNSTLPHRFRNISDAPCDLVTACTPPF